jgi:hypothetical protein
MTMRATYCNRCGGPKYYGNMSRGVRVWGLRCPQCDLTQEERDEEQRQLDRIFDAAKEANNG